LNGYQTIDVNIVPVNSYPEVMSKHLSGLKLVLGV